MPRSCRCGHPVESHLHYRGGTDCGQCTCQRYRTQRDTILTDLIGGLWFAAGAVISWLRGAKQP